MNTFGQRLRLTTYGESHGPAIGGILDGFPAGITLDLDKVQRELNRRRPGQSKYVTQRKEPDEVVFYSGIFEGKSTGMPIGFQIKNTNQKSRDYGELATAFRPSHADYVYTKKYGLRDYRGGGRSSARETASWVVAGALAKQLFTDLEIHAYVKSVGSLALDKLHEELDFSLTEQTPIRCPDLEMASRMADYISKVKKNGDTVGGTIGCVIKNAPLGLGEPTFDKLHARLGQSMLTINAAKAFEYGSGFAGCQMLGSQHNDLQQENGKTVTNYSGGIQGGISNGMDIYFRVGFKPVATLIQKQNMLTEDGHVNEVQGRGRHDPCVVPRAVPIVEAMAALVLADFSLIG